MPHCETKMHIAETSFQDVVAAEITSATSKIESTLRRYALLHALFVVIVAGTLTSIPLYFLQSLSDTAFLSITLAIGFLAAFAYFLLHVYWEASKNQQLIEALHHFIERLKDQLDYNPGLSESHIDLSQALCRLADSLKGKETNIFKAPRKPHFLESATEKLCHWFYWHDFHHLREKALEAAVDEQIELVKCEPTNPDAHASLANTYIVLSSMYPSAQAHEEEGGWLDPSKKYRPMMAQKFRIASERAVEELKILSNYAPSDPWIHEQLAYSYRDLQMPKEEIKEYELVLKMIPNDIEVIYKLGVLYFQQGNNVQGLQLYEYLRHSHYQKAEQLIEHYGAYRVSSLLDQT